MNPVADIEEPTVCVTSFVDLFAHATFPLAVDAYQRGFVWTDDKIDQLAADLVAFQEERNAETPDYYMGSILLHEDRIRKKLFIIDGQQRLSALCVLRYCLLQSLPQKCELEFSPSSARNLMRAVRRFFEKGTVKVDPTLFDHIHFTQITVPTIDWAFSFFDTQNNRGVPLQPTDLLKAYHLRAIKGAARVEFQRMSAERWERLQDRGPVAGHGDDFAPTLFAHFLWRARVWRGQRKADLHFESHDAIIKEFQSPTMEPDSNAIPIYRSRRNLLGKCLRIDISGALQIVPCSVPLSWNPADLPFALRQPIASGRGFFLYADKYANVLEGLRNDHHQDPEAMAFNKFYDSVIRDLSLYLREAFDLATFMYVDQFGYKRLLEFALWLDYAIGSVRFDKRYVRRATAKNFLTDQSVNLLDVISAAFIPQEVINLLKADELYDKVYKRDDGSIRRGEGVQGVYKDRVLRYYKRADGSFRDRRNWITSFFIEERLSESAS